MRRNEDAVIEQNNIFKHADENGLRRTTVIQSESAVKAQIPESLYATEPIVNLLADENAAIRFRGVTQIQSGNNRRIVTRLRHLSYDSAETVQLEAGRKLKPIEIFYRRKFNFFQDHLKKYPNRLGYQLGFAVICLRYAQIWVEDSKLQEYFLRQAYKYLNQLIRIYEPKTRYFYYRGQVLREFNQPRLAAEDFKKVLRQNPHHRGAILALIDLYLRQQQPHIALQLIGKLKQKRLPMPLQQAVEFWFV